MSVGRTHTPVQTSEYTLRPPPRRGTDTMEGSIPVVETDTDLVLDQASVGPGDFGTEGDDDDVEVVVEVRTHHAPHTGVEAYVEDVVMRLEPFPNCPALDEIMEALFHKGVATPVPARDLIPVLIGTFDKKTLDGMFREQAPLVTRLLLALNGTANSVVPQEVLREAAHKEKVMSVLKHGWGVPDPPPYATAYRLLVSSGLSPDLLPPYKTLPPGTRERLTAAWKAACRQFGWGPCEPEKDTRASDTRARKRG